jgi:hypothetical protein
MRKTIADGGVNFSKVYRVTRQDERKFAIAPYQMTPITVGEDGWIISDRQTSDVSEQERKSEEVYNGIHVYVGEAEVWEDCNFAVPVEVSADDFVGTNPDGSEAVFTKIKVNPSAIADALKETAADVDLCDDDDDDDDDDWDDDDDDWDDDDDDWDDDEDEWDDDDEI